MERSQSNVDRPMFTRTPLPTRFCNSDRLMQILEARGIDGVVMSSVYNVFYLTGFNPIAHKADEPRPYAVILSRHAPDHPVLVVADYYLSHFLQQPTWVEDIRPFRAVMLPLDIPVEDTAIDRFILDAGREVPWVQQARQHYAPNLGEACQRALNDLGLRQGRVAFDDLRLASQLSLTGVETVDGYNVMMAVRQVKTDDELHLLRQATRLNQAAIERTASAWERGMSWRELNQTYHQAVVALGGFVHDPGGMVLAHPRGSAAGFAVTLETGFDDFGVEPGMHIMFDCHGTWNQYCWDGGKTWVVDGAPAGQTKTLAQATAEAMRVIEAAMRPGVRISALQAKGREVYRKYGVSNAESSFLFFHGLGLSHMDLEQSDSDWEMEAGMVVATHLLCPGDEHHRMWLEDVALVRPEGAEPFFTWDFDPMTGS